MQRSLHAASEWANMWGSSFNVDKFVCLHFGWQNPKTEYAMNGSIIPANSVGKDLGVWISADLKWAYHCKQRVVTAKKTVHLIRRSLKYFNAQTYILLYKALVIPLVEFATPAWCPYMIKDIQLVESVQRLATRLMPGLPDLSYHDWLKKLGLQMDQFARCCC